MQDFLQQYWMLLIPLMVIQLGLTLAALIDLVRREQVVGENKWIWAALVLFVSYFGPIIYFAFGRKE